MDKDGLVGAQGGTYAVGAGDGLIPGAARLQMDFAAGFDGGAVANGGEDDAAGVRHQHDRASANEQVYRLGQGAGSGGQQIAVLNAEMVQAVVADGQGCGRAMGIDAAFQAAAPGIDNDIADWRVAVDAGQKILPRPHDRRLIGIGRATRRRCRPVPGLFSSH
jgi:hypothetical protein